MRHPIAEALRPLLPTGVAATTIALATTTQYHRATQYGDAIITPDPASPARVPAEHAATAGTIAYLLRPTAASDTYAAWAVLTALHSAEVTR